MKSATIPAVRVEPELRAEIESILNEGETLSEFVEKSVREQARRRRNEAEFVARGIQALENSRMAGDFVDSKAMLDRLDAKLNAAKNNRERERAASKSRASAQR